MAPSGSTACRRAPVWRNTNLDADFMQSPAVALLENGRTIRDVIDRRGTADAQRPFLLAPDDGINLNYAGLKAATRAFADRLQSSHGIAHGDHVGLFLPNGANFVVAYLGAMYLGAIACPVNTQLQDPEIEYILASARIKLLCAPQEWTARLRRILEKIPGRCIVVAAEELCAGLPPDPGLPDAVPMPALPPSNGDDLAQIVYTSGSTGRPKGVMLTHSNLLYDCAYIVDWHHMDRDDRALCILPLFHTNAEVLSVLCTLYAGGSVVVPRQFHASQFWPLAKQHVVTWCSAAPTIFYILLRRREQTGAAEDAGHRLRFFISGTSALPVDLMRDFERAFGAIILEGYGLTETVCRVAFNPHPPAAQRRPGEDDGYRKLGSVGKPIGDAKIRIVDDADRPLAQGERGEIVLRGSVLMQGYFNNDAETAKAFKGGWFHTGDIGYLDADGYLFIVDRKKDMIIRGGQNIYPREVDNVLVLHPAIAEAAVIGIADEKYGEEVKAYVVRREGASVSPEEIIGFCREHLAAYKCPKSVAFIDAMPKGPTGKLLRAQLARFEREFSQEEKKA